LVKTYFWLETLFLLPGIDIQLLQKVHIFEILFTLKEKTGDKEEGSEINCKYCSNRFTVVVLGLSCSLINRHLV